MECYCDYEPHEVFATSMRTARKSHRCSECGHNIGADERYEYVFAKIDGDVWIAKTCPRCLALREWVTAHVPCFCWYYESMLDDADNIMRDYACEVPGMGMEYGRLRVGVKRGASTEKGE